MCRVSTWIEDPSTCRIWSESGNYPVSTFCGRSFFLIKTGISVSLFLKVENHFTLVFETGSGSRYVVQAGFKFLEINGQVSVPWVLGLKA